MGIDFAHTFPFMLRHSKHSEPFFSNLLEAAEQTDQAEGSNAGQPAAFSGLALLPPSLHADEHPESERQTEIENHFH